MARTTGLSQNRSPLRQAEVSRALPQFRILGQLGVGSSGSVFKAEDSEQNVVAIKVLRIEDNDDELLDRFDIECLTLKALSNPAIPTFYSSGRVGLLSYAVMEWVSGSSLEKCLDGRKKRLRLAVIVRMLRQLCDILHYAHGEGITHRDVKPGNILMNDDGGVYLADFGLARRAFVPSGHTKIGVGLGTQGYMAPEQARGYDVDCRADVFSLGVLLYLLMTLIEPVGVPKAPSQCHRRNPKVFDAIIHKATQIDPEERFPDMMALKKEINQAWLKVRIYRFLFWFLVVMAILLGFWGVWHWGLSLRVV